MRERRATPRRGKRSWRASSARPSWAAASAT